MIPCTWKGCEGKAVNPQMGSGGMWSNLCEAHTHELDAAIASADPKQIMRSWVLAQGGAAKMAHDMVEEPGDAE